MAISSGTYSKTTNFKLFVGASTTDPPVAPGSDTFTRVFNLTNVKRGSLTQQAAEFYTLDDEEANSIGGRLAPVDWTGRLLHDKALAPHAGLEADVAVGGGQFRNYRVEYPDNTRFDFVGFCTLWDEEEAEATGDATPPKAVSFTIRQSGGVTKSAVT